MDSTVLKTTSLISSNDENSLFLDESDWHNDLALAAQLGKALLDRNRKLELALEQSRRSEVEKDEEIKFLVKELANLRESSQQKMAYVDDADRYNQELEQCNREMMQKLTQSQQKIQRMSNTIACLEEQIVDLNEQLGSTNFSTSMNSEAVTCKPRCKSPPVPVNESRAHTVKYPPLYNSFGWRYKMHLDRAKEIFIDDELHDQPQLGNFHCFTELGRCPRNVHSYQFDVTQYRGRMKHSQTRLFTDCLTGNNNSSLSTLIVYDDANLGVCDDDGDASRFTSSGREVLQFKRSISWPQNMNELCLNSAFGLFDEVIGLSHPPPSTLMSGDQLSGDLQAPIKELSGSTNLSVTNSEQCVHSSKTDESNGCSHLESYHSTQQSANETLVPITTKVKTVRVMDQLNDLLDDVNFVNCLDRAYNPMIKSQYISLTDESYQPQYKKLFHDLFDLLKQTKQSHETAFESQLKV